MYADINHFLGFSLVELIIAVAIIGILSAIAIPSYQAYKYKTDNSLAMTDIQNIRSIIDRYFIENSSYPATIADIAASLSNSGRGHWGNAYNYLNIINGGNGIKGAVRKDTKENPINSLYDLYSMGKNGKTKKQLDNKDSVDDIILARDGAFIGLSSDY